ncbi:hypothetical protein Btru_047342, partial [Bulinus truncatus]
MYDVIFPPNLILRDRSCLRCGRTIKSTMGKLHPYQLPPSKLRIFVVLLVTSCCTNSALAVFTACGGNLTDQAGVILSPNFPNNYPNDATCYWNITVAPNQVIDFRFRRLDLDRYSDQNCYDSVVLYDGPSTQYQIISEYYQNNVYYYQCGSSSESRILNMAFRSTSNHMYVAFRSDNHNSRIGFSASYWAHECPPFKYGNEVCNNTCVCNQTNTLYCANHNGACACRSGWTSVDCTVDTNECLDPNKCDDPYGVCINTPGSFVCQCKPGMIKNTSGNCENAKICSHKRCSHTCAVTSEIPPNETCYCPKGMKLDPTNNSTCIVCDNWSYGENCSYMSECDKVNTQSYNKINGLCRCYLNFAGSSCTDDIDECRIAQYAPCNLYTNHAECYNTHGSFKCVCQVGFERVNSTTCDKCGKILTAPSGIITSGDYYSPSSLTEVVECSWIIRGHNGNVVSLNFQSLSLWYSSNAYDDTRPAYIEFHDGSNKSSKLLAIFNGGPSFSLPQEIIRSSSNEMFIIQYTGYYNGYYGYLSKRLSATYWTHECHPFTYNTNCTQPCSCDTNHTQYCNSTNGQCVCKSGWTGADCSVDIDECLENPLSCPDYSVCQNTVGSFECKCKEGLTMSLNKTCV